MSNGLQYLEVASAAYTEVGDLASTVHNVVQLGDEQAEARRGAIETINKMCDALQLACDIISKEISSAITEYGRIRNDSPEVLNSYFSRTATKLTEPSLRVLLHEGQVCGELHALGDRFRQPFSDVSRGALSVWGNVGTFFRRSNAMSDALNGLLDGEMNYLRDFADFLNEARDEAEQASWLGDSDSQRVAGDGLTELLREKRRTIQDDGRRIRDSADDCIAKLH